MMTRVRGPAGERGRSGKSKRALASFPFQDGWSADPWAEPDELVPTPDQGDHSLCPASHRRAQPDLRQSRHSHIARPGVPQPGSVEQLAPAYRCSSHFSLVATLPDNHRCEAIDAPENVPIHWWAWSTVVRVRTASPRLRAASSLEHRLHLIVAVLAGDWMCMVRRLTRAACRVPSTSNTTHCVPCRSHSPPVFSSFSRGRATRSSRNAVRNASTGA